MLQGHFRRVGAFAAMISVLAMTPGSMSRSVAADGVDASIMKVAFTRPGQAKAIVAPEPCYRGKDNAPGSFGDASSDQAAIALQVERCGDESSDPSTSPSAALEMLRFEFGQQFMNMNQVASGKPANHLPMLNAFLHAAMILSGDGVSPATAPASCRDPEDCRTGRGSHPIGATLARTYCPVASPASGSSRDGAPEAAPS